MSIQFRLRPSQRRWCNSIIMLFLCNFWPSAPTCNNDAVDLSFPTQVETTSSQTPSAVWSNEIDFELDLTRVIYMFDKICFPTMQSSQSAKKNYASIMTLYDKVSYCFFELLLNNKTWTVLAMHILIRTIHGPVSIFFTIVDIIQNQPGNHDGTLKWAR